MASVHCPGSCEESSQQKNQQHTSLGQKVTGLFRGHHHSNNSNSQSHAQGTNRREHKKNLFQKIKDGFSSDSSSDSDSDNEHRHRRKY